jgi:hypothetical protein
MIRASRVVNRIVPRRTRMYLMARHLSGTSKPSMAVRRHSERTTQSLSTLSTTWARFLTTKGSMARHLSGTSESSVAVGRHSGGTTPPLSAPSTAWFLTCKESMARHWSGTSEPYMAATKSSARILRPAEPLETWRLYTSVKMSLRTT